MQNDLLKLANREIYLLIPAFNPPATFVKLIQQIRCLSTVPIVVVDDGSSVKKQSIFDEIIKTENLFVIKNLENRGKGYSLKRGIEYIHSISKKYPYIVTADSDNQHSANDIFKLMNLIKEEDDRFFLGVRSFQGDIPKRSLAGNYLCLFILKNFFNLKLKDSQCGLRAFSYSLSKEIIELKENNYDLELSMIFKTLENDIDIEQIDIETIYINDNEESQFKVLKDSFSIGVVVFKNISFKSIFRKLFKNLYPLLPMYNFLLFFKKKRALKDVFKDIYKKNKWGNNQSVSGEGSTYFETEKIRTNLPFVLSEYKISTFLDIPCGDCNWINKIDFGDIKYLGADIVDELVNENINKFPAKDFLVLDITKDSIPKVDLIFSRDLFVHFSYESILMAIDNVKKSNSKYLMMTSFSSCKKNMNIRNGSWRKLNFELAPFNFPKPILSLNENCREGRFYADKELCMWKVSELP